MTTLVAGVDSSTQSCTVVIRDARSGALVRRGRAPHPGGTEVDPEHWWRALHAAIGAAGGLDDVAALSIAGQQHGLICLDAEGRVIRDALLWNDTRSARAAADLVGELGARAWAERVGTVPVASLTVAKLRWLAEHEPDAARRTAAVCLPHDWLTWRLCGGGELPALTTDRSDASGTGYFDSTTGRWCRDLLALAVGDPDILLPRIVAPDGIAGLVGELRVGAGAGDNAAAMIGAAAERETVVSLGTSGVVTARHPDRPVDPTGIVAGFADLRDAHLPLVCTLNAARVLDATAALLGVDRDRFDQLALAAPPGAEGLVFVSYLAGERTPDLPEASGALHGMTQSNITPANLARAAVEGMLCGVAGGLDALAGHRVETEAVRLIGGAAAASAVRRIAASVFGIPVSVPAAGDYVADGAARQAAWMLAGGDEIPAWPHADPPVRRYEPFPAPGLRERYAEAAGKFLRR